MYDNVFYNYHESAGIAILCSITKTIRTMRRLGFSVTRASGRSLYFYKFESSGYKAHTHPPLVKFEPQIRTINEVMLSGTCQLITKLVECCLHWGSDIYW